MSLDEDTRRRLLAAKAVAIARSQGLVPVGEPQPLMGGAATLVDGGRGWVLVQREPERALGAALAWSLRHGAISTICVIDVGVDGRPQRRSAEIVAAKAAGLASPPPVLMVTGSRVETVKPPPLPDPGPYVPAPQAAFRLDDADAARTDVIVHEDGTLTFEVLGLEVARVAADGTMAVGAGKHDREATSELYGGEPTREALVRAAEVVRQERRLGAPPGPANLLQRERWLRDALVGGPHLLASAGLVGPLLAVGDPMPPKDLRRPRPAGAAAEMGRVLVVCSAGVNLDLVPTAAWLWSWARFAGQAREDEPNARAVPPGGLLGPPGAAERIVLVVPHGDAAPILRDMAPLLRVPTTVVAVTPPWEDGPR